MPVLPSSSAVLFGLDRKTFDAAHIVRAVMEGTVLNLGYGFARMRELGLKPAEIRATGGGAKSRLWLQIVADVFGTPVVTLRESEAAAYGAALQSVWNWRLAEGEKVAIADIAAKWVAKDRLAAEPDPKNAVLYADLQARFNALWKTLWSRISRPAGRASPPELPALYERPSASAVSYMASTFSTGVIAWMLWQGARM